MFLFSFPFFLSLLVSGAFAQPHSIEDYGAVAGIDTPEQALINGKAFLQAVYAANASAAPSMRSVLVPEGKVFAFLPASSQINEIYDVIVYVEGTLEGYTKNFTHFWPGYPNPWNMICFGFSRNLSFISETQQGVINGRGNDWWWYAILVIDHRPNLFIISSTSDFFLQGILFLNSPMYHVGLWDMLDVQVYDTTVRVDVEDQLDIMRYLGNLDKSASITTVLQSVGLTFGEEDSLSIGADGSIHPPIPMIWALNTDGIDISGRNIIVQNCSITNFDDTVCVKPLTGDGSSFFGSNCTSNFTILDTTVTWGVGISMGSVPPDVGDDCIDGVIVINATFHNPLKAVYIKPNPAKYGTNSTGLIANVLYENLTIHDPFWWTIYIGTQQENQPHGGADTGCSFFYPIFNTSCPTDPQVTVTNITLRSVDVYNPLMSPGILIANATNPATNIVFDHVIFHNVSKWPVSTGYLCQNFHGTSIGSYPEPCFMSQTDD